VTSRFFAKHVATHNVALWNSSRLLAEGGGRDRFPCKYPQCSKYFKADRMKIYINHLATTHNELEQK
jgi:hypothetical protein